MLVRIIVNGAAGRMGQLVVSVLRQRQDFQIVAQSGRQDNLAELIVQHQAQVVFDVTSAESAYLNAEMILNAGARPIIGTSGLNQSQVEKLQKIAQVKALGGIIAPNFSIGALLMMRFAAAAAKYFPRADIIEMHHAQKKDAPSGTATRTAEMMGTHPLIHSIRLPGILADQQVIFGGQEETLTIEHKTIGREAFTAGIQLACDHIMSVNELAYGLDRFL